MFLQEDMNATPSDGGMQDDAAMATPIGDDTAAATTPMGDDAMNEEEKTEEAPTEEAAM